MISETAILGCDNLPESMRGQFDKPWNFVGEVKTNRMDLMCHCKKCNMADVNYFKPQQRATPQRLVFVRMAGHLFVTDDMIEVMVYFGVCQECEAIYWARSGPPFRRARRCVGVSS